MERTRTVREAIREELLRGAATAREISERVSIREKDVAGHLEHLEKSLRARGERLVIQPASCISLTCSPTITQRTTTSIAPVMISSRL